MYLNLDVRMLASELDTEPFQYLHCVATSEMRPEPVRIDDLDNPQFALDAAAMMRAGAELGAAIDLTPTTLMSQACIETGLGDYGADPSFDERVEVLLRALRDEAGLSSFGKVTTSAQMVQLLTNRLLVQDLLTHHPEIHQIEIVSPIVIAGLPRTGTTHLHNLLAADPRLRSLPYWESLEPVLAETDRPSSGERDPRRVRTESGLAFLESAAPHFKRMHEMTVDHVHEEIQLLAMDFSSMLFETTAPMPTWRDYYLGHDQTPHYEYLKTVLKVLTWLRGGDRWLLKSPQHIEQFGALMSVFPDAIVLVTHREPVSVTVSMCTMIAYTARLHLEKVDPQLIGTYWADRIERMLASCTRDRELLPPDHSLDIRFEDFMADDIATVERIYDVANMPFDSQTRDAIVGYGRDHPRGRHGGLIYEITDFGLDAAERRRALAPYTERFLGSMEVDGRP